MKTKKADNKFILFNKDIDHISLPQKFTFPFYYQSHPIALVAVKQLQNYLLHQTSIEHNFGLRPIFNHIKPIGKMFGILVVKNTANELGFLTAFSGKIANSNQHQYFVPPIYDMLDDNGFFIQGMHQLNTYSAEMAKLKENDKITAFEKLYLQEKKLMETEIEALRERMRKAKKVRKQKRTIAKEQLKEADFQELLKNLSAESINYSYQLKNFTKYWNARIFLSKEQFEKENNKIVALKEKRKALSNQLQEKLFDQYNFINKDKEAMNVQEIFKDTFHKTPPAGAGECAAPKLLQYAFQNNYTPIALSEFWWGESPRDIIRKHQHFYPACRGKCEPILSHMLNGIELEANPLLTDYGADKKVKILYEEDTFLVINKPFHFLSVPGKHIEDCVWLRMKNRYPNAQGPLIVHRLDMATSGIMIIAKTKEAHKNLQAQFINRTVKKQYTALLDGIIEHPTGTIDLPLRVDLDDRPRQMVCYQHGKPAKTQYETIQSTNNQTLIQLYPITGRTHQLRMHTAHPKGLNTPIVGDVLYGKKANRLHLHASFIEFKHPITQKNITIEDKAKFSFEQKRIK